MVVNREQHPQVNQSAARQFADFLLRPDVQRKIAAFGIDRFGEPLFYVEASP
ncbi:MAG: hypothetical protein ACT4QC_06725 [Planctomycetaceae bacterium]